MKKVLTACVAVGLSLCLLACQHTTGIGLMQFVDHGIKKPSTVETSSQSNIDNNEFDAFLEHPLYPRFQELMGIYVTEKMWDSIYLTDEYMEVKLKDHSLIRSNYVIELYDGSSFKPPVTYQEICDAGWECTYDPEISDLPDPFPSGEAEGCSFINADRKTFSAELINHTAEPIPLEKTKVNRFILGGGHTADFSINGIKPGSTVEDIMAQFGLPRECTYHRYQNGQERFKLIYVSSKYKYTMDFEIDPATATLEKVSYAVRSH